MTKSKVIDLTKLLEPYSGQWVALTPDEKEVVGASMDLDEALKQAKAKGVPRPFIIKSPSYEMVGFFH